jgi:hypothetical protein
VSRGYTSENMGGDRYSVRMAESYTIAENATYEALLARLVEFTVLAAVARSVDENDWEQEQLRRNGLSALQIFHNGKAAWDDAPSFEAERAEARRVHIAWKFDASNELDCDLYRRLDRDLCARWRSAGYETPSLLYDMKRLFSELEHDASDRADHARRSLLRDLRARLASFG